MAKAGREVAEDLESGRELRALAPLRAATHAIRHASRDDAKRIAQAVVNGAVEWYHKPAYEKGEDLGRATTSIAAEAAINIVTDGLGTLRKIEKAADAADHFRNLEKGAEQAAHAAEHLRDVERVARAAERVPTVDELSRAAAAADRGGLTSSGRALQKHGGRQGSAFPAAQSSPADISRAGQTLVDDILTNPGSTVTKRHHARFGDVLEVRAPDGRGVRYDAAGRFIGFLEP